MTYHIFCDESGLKEKFSIYGGILISKRDFIYLDNLKETLSILCNSESEMHWTSSLKTERDYNKYIKWLDFFENHIDLSFRCITIENAKRRDKAFYFDKDDVVKHTEKGFYKMHEISIWHKFCKHYTEYAKFYCDIDKRTTKFDLDIMRINLNKKFPLHKETTRISKIYAIKHQCSKKCRIIQLSDFLLGAINYHKNGHYLKKEANEWKSKMAFEVARRFTSSNILGNTFGGKNCKFQIWNCDLDYYKMENILTRSSKN